MPANLPPDYFEAEKRYRQAKTHSEKIDCLEEMLTIMPKHKGTDKLRADLRRRISKLKDASQTKKGVSKQESVFRIDADEELVLTISMLSLTTMISSQPPTSMAMGFRTTTIWTVT